MASPMYARPRWQGVGRALKRRLDGALDGFYKVIASRRELSAHFDKNGYLFILDRTDCSLVRVVPFVDRITWGEIDSNGKVTAKVFPDKEGDPVHFWPGPAGAIRMRSFWPSRSPPSRPLAPSVSEIWRASSGEAP